MVAMKRVQYQGHTLNQRTLNMLKEAERRLGHSFSVMQGSYHPGVGASAGTHDGGGVLDVAPNSGGTTANQKVKALREVGFASWHRLPSQGPWPEHIHSVAMGDRELASLAAVQVRAYRDGYNGLGHLGRGGRDTGPHVGFDTWKTYKEKHLFHPAPRPAGPAPTLRKGATGGWVRYLQHKLNLANQDEHIHVTGVYDAFTVARVKQYKTRHHFHPYNGVAGHRVWEALGVK